MRAKQAKKRSKKQNSIRKVSPFLSPIWGRGKQTIKKQKPYIVFDLFNLIQYMVSVAGVAGFEPTNDGVRGKLLFQKSAVFARF